MTPTPPPEDAPVEVVLEDPRWEAAGLRGLAERAAEAALRDAGLDPAAHEVVVLGCSDARIAALNGRFRDKPAPTNVLAWPSLARDPAVPAEPGHLGDVAVAFETCEREAAERGLTLAQHASHLVVHAVLHLLGHDHDRDERAALMEAREGAILLAIGLPDPHASDLHASGPSASGSRATA